MGSWLSQVILGWLLAGSVLGQVTRHPAYIRYGVKEGLPNREVYCVTKDREGFIWIGTEDGIARFDGHRFVSYGTQDGLPDKAILQIKEDREGRLWLITASGSLGYQKAGRFYNRENTPVLGDLACKNTIICCWQHPNGDIYFGSMGGEAKVLHSDGTVEQLYPLGNSHWVLAFDAVGKTPIAGSTTYHFAGVDTLGAKRGQRCELMGRQPSASVFPIKGLFTANGDFWVSFGRTIYILPAHGTPQLYENNIPGISRGRIVYLGAAQDGKVWVGTSKGAYLFADADLSRGPILQVMPEDEVRAVHEDGEDGLWLATTLGLVHIPNLAIRVGFEPPVKFEHAELKDLELTHEGDFWVAASPSGFYALNRYLKPLQQLAVHPDSLWDIPVQIHRVHDSLFYLGTEHNLFEWTGSQFEKTQPNNYADFQNYGDSLCICTSFGWYLVDPRRAKEVLWGSGQLKTRGSRQPERCYHLERDTEGRLWIANASGIYCYQHGQVHKIKAAEPYLRGKPLSMRSDPSGGMWVGTDGSGLFYIQNDACFRVGTREGLVSNQISDVHVAHDGTVWIASPEGISRLRGDRLRKTLRIDNMRREAGLPDLPVKKIIGQGDSVLVVMGNQILVFSQSLLDHPTPAPVPRLLSANVMGRDSAMEEGVSLPYELNSIGFRYTAIGFKSGDNITYRYRLLPSKVWITTTSGEANFVALNAGDYIFELQTKALGTQWSRYTAHASFHIQKPWWKTLWFLFLAIFSLIGCLGVVIWWLLSQYEAVHDRRQRLVRAEHLSLVNQMNPHFISNSLQSIQSYFINRDLETANDYMADFGELMRCILDSSRTYCTTLSSELNLVRLYLQMERMRTSDGFNFRIEVDPAIQADSFLLPPLLLQPFLENAIWHGIVPRGKNGLIEIVIQTDTDGIQVLLRDNGIGRDESQAAKAKFLKTRKSHATDIVRERLDLLNQRRKPQFKFWITDRVDAQGLAAGTDVVFVLPFNFKESND
jgi:ligand-binding sensor domain-containing protein